MHPFFKFAGASTSEPEYVTPKKSQLRLEAERWWANCDTDFKVALISKYIPKKYLALGKGHRLSMAAGEVLIKIQRNLIYYYKRHTNGPVGKLITPLKLETK